MNLEGVRHRSVLYIVWLFLRGHVSRDILLTVLSLSFVCFFGTFAIGLQSFPGADTWQKCIMSHVISPNRNPETYWLPSLGIAIATLLSFPIAGYLEQRVRAITPRMGRSAGVTFTLGLICVLGVAIPLPTQSSHGWWTVHETLARASAATMGGGLLCCCAIALKDRLRILGGQRILSRGLTLCWTLIAALPAL